jgi:hypothetical protein
MEWLAKAYDARDVHLIYLPVDPKWDLYKADPRFQALLKRCGLHGLDTLTQRPGRAVQKRTAQCPCEG